MDIRKASSLVGAMLLVGSTAGWVDAPQRMAELVIRGNAVCDTMDGSYTLNWVVINPEENTEVTIASAAESGAYKDVEIYLDPTNLKGGESATASDDVPGSTKGAVTLTVHYVFNDTGGEAQSDGSISLDGTCKK